MRFVSTRWSLGAAGLISALALAACSSSTPPPPPPPPPVVAPTPMPPPPVVRSYRKHSKKYIRRHRAARKHRKR